MSVITIDEGNIDEDEDEAEIDYNLDDEDIAQRLSGQIPAGRGGGWSAPHQQHQAPSASSGNRGAHGRKVSQLQRSSLNSDSMGLTADIEDYLADTDSGSESGGIAYQQQSSNRGMTSRAQSMRQDGGGYGSQAYQRNYSTRY